MGRSRFNSKSIAGAGDSGDDGIWQQFTGWCNSDSCDPLSLVCALVVVIYIALAHPNNTPAFFGSRVFKFVIFTVVVVVTLMDTKIGVIFGLAMTLSVAYSYIRSNQETFLGHENWVGGDNENGGDGEDNENGGDGEEQEEEYTAPSPSLEESDPMGSEGSDAFTGAAPYHSM